MRRFLRPIIRAILLELLVEFDVISYEQAMVLLE